MKKALARLEKEKTVENYRNAHSVARGLGGRIDFFKRPSPKSIRDTSPLNKEASPMNSLQKYAAKRRLTELLKQAAFAQPASGAQARQWTDSAKRNAEDMGHRARYDFVNKQTVPVDQSTMGTHRKSTRGVPAIGTLRAKDWTQRAKANAQKMGHTARRDFNRGMTLPVRQSMPSS